MKKALQEAGGDVKKLEKIFGLNDGDLGTNPTVISIDDPKNMRMPDGNEIGAIPEKYIPGGYTCDNRAEVVIDPVPKGEYEVKSFNDPAILDWIDSRGGK